MKITKAELIDWVNEHYDYFEEVEEVSLELVGFGRHEQLNLNNRLFKEDEDEDLEE